MSAPAVQEAEFQAALAAIRDGVDQSCTVAGDLVEGVNSVLVLLPPGIPVRGVQAGIEEMYRVLDEAITELRRLLDNAGDPAALRAAGAVWATDVGATASRLAGLATLNGVQVDDYWTGTAATAYRNTLPAQNAALTAVKAACDDLDSTLNDLATAITVFWVAVGGALVTFVVALIAAALTAGTVVGAPAAAGIAIAACVAFAAFVVGAVAAVANIATAAADRSAELDRRLSNDTAFPTGAWPRSTTPISGDGSITDGDDTDWHLE